MSVGLSFEQQIEEYHRQHGRPGFTPVGQPQAGGVAGDFESQILEYHKQHADPTFSMGPAAGFTEPAAATRLDQPRTPATAGDKQFRAASQQVAQKILGTSDQLTTGERHAQSLFTGIMSGVGDVAGLGVRAL